jgi:cation diffusion facilitator CzcD-associated flavoprotein CzcO
MSSDLDSPRRAARPVAVIGAGQSGLAAARSLRELNMSAVLLEAGDRSAGSWPCYYDSLQAFSPAGFSSMLGMPFPGDPGRYPTRDEVADYLERYAAALDVEIQTNTRVVTVRQEDREFLVVTADGQQLRAAGIVAASGSFSSPYRPAFPGEKSFTAELSHVADYRNPTPYAGKRSSSSVRATPPPRSPTSLRPSRTSRSPHATPSGSFRSGLEARTCTIGCARPALTPYPPNG